MVARRHSAAHAIADGTDARFDALLTPAAYQAAWRYAYYLAPVYEDAQDLLQDSLAHAYLRLSQLREGARFTPWLMRIVRTQHLMALRRARRGLLPAPPDHPAPPPASHYACLPPELAAAVLGLPQKLREAVDLHYLHQLSVAEMARVLGIGQSAAKLRLYRARLILRRALGQAAPGELRRSERGE